MYYIIHYSIRPANRLALSVLDRLHISYTVAQGYKTEENSLVAFQISESDPRNKEIRTVFCGKVFNEEELRGIETHARIENALYFPKYEEKDFYRAKWVEIFGITTKIDPANNEDISSVTCIFDRTNTGAYIGHHRVQSSPIEVRRTLKWGNSQFFSGAIGTEGLFCDDRAVSIMKHTGLKGLQYGPVLKWRTGIPIPNVHQILPTHVIPDGAFYPIRDMESYTCEMCGMQMLRVSGQRYLYGVKDSYLRSDIDFYRTLPLFLDYSSKKYNGGRIHYIISQHAYQILKENRMCRGVEFTPLTSVP